MITSTGFEQIMDEPRVSPHFVPNTNKDVTILYGEPINALVEPLVDDFRAQFPNGAWRPATYERGVAADLDEEPVVLQRLRSRIADQLRVGLMDLGKRTAEVEKRPPGKIVGW